MFKTLKEFETATYKFLIDIQNGKLYQDELSIKLSNTDYMDVLEFILKNKLTKGVHLNKLEGFPLELSGKDQRLSYNGLKFIEEYKAKYK